MHLLLSPKRKRSCKSTSSKKTASNRQPNSTQSLDSTASALSSPVESPSRLPKSYDDAVLRKNEAFSDSRYELFLNESELQLSKSIQGSSHQNSTKFSSIGTTTPPSSCSSRYHTRSTIIGSPSKISCMARSGLKSDSLSPSLLSPSPESSPESISNFGKDANTVTTTLDRTLPDPFIEIERSSSKKSSQKIGNVGNNDTLKCLRSSLGSVRNTNQSGSISTKNVVCGTSILLGVGSEDGRGKRGRVGSFPTNVSKSNSHHTFICPGSADLRPKMDDWVSSFEGESDDEKSSSNSSIINQKWGNSKPKNKLEHGKRVNGGIEKIHGYGLRSSKSSLFRGSGSDDDQFQHGHHNEQDHDIQHHQLSNLSDSHDFEGKLSELHVGRRSRTIFGDSSTLSFNTDFPDETTSFVDALISTNYVPDITPFSGKDLDLGSCSSESENAQLKGISHETVNMEKTLNPNFVSEISRSLDRLGSTLVVTGNPYTNSRPICSSNSSSACPSNTKSSITSCHSGLSSSCTSTCPSPLNHHVQRMYGSIPRSLQSNVLEENVKMTKSDVIGERGGVRRGAGVAEFQVPRSRLLWSPEKERRGCMEDLIERKESMNILSNKVEKHSLGQSRNNGFESPKKNKYWEPDSRKSIRKDDENRNEKEEENGNGNGNDDDKLFMRFAKFDNQKNYDNELNSQFSCSCSGSGSVSMSPSKGYPIHSPTFSPSSSPSPSSSISNIYPQHLSHSPISAKNSRSKSLISSSSRNLFSSCQSSPNSRNDKNINKIINDNSSNDIDSHNDNDNEKNSVDDFRRYYHYEGNDIHCNNENQCDKESDDKSYHKKVIIQNIYSMNTNKTTDKEIRSNIHPPSSSLTRTPPRPSNNTTHTHRTTHRTPHRSERDHTLGDLGTPVSEAGSPADIDMDTYIHSDHMDGGFSHRNSIELHSEIKIRNIVNNNNKFGNSNDDNTVDNDKRTMLSNDLSGVLTAIENHVTNGTRDSNYNLSSSTSGSVDAECSEYGFVQTLQTDSKDCINTTDGEMNSYLTNTNDDSINISMRRSSNDINLISNDCYNLKDFQIQKNNNNEGNKNNIIESARTLGQLDLLFHSSLDVHPSYSSPFTTKNTWSDGSISLHDTEIEDDDEDMDSKKNDRKSCLKFRGESLNSPMNQDNDIDDDVTNNYDNNDNGNNSDNKKKNNIYNNNNINSNYNNNNADTSYTFSGNTTTCCTDNSNHNDNTFNNNNNNNNNKTVEKGIEINQIKNKIVIGNQIQVIRPLPEQSAFDQCGMSPRLPFSNNQINNDDNDNIKTYNSNYNTQRNYSNISKNIDNNNNNNNNDKNNYNVINNNSTSGKVDKTNVVNAKMADKINSNIHHSNRGIMDPRTPLKSVCPATPMRTPSWQKEKELDVDFGDLFSDSKSSEKKNKSHHRNSHEKSNINCSYNDITHNDNTECMLDTLSLMSNRVLISLSDSIVSKDVSFHRDFEHEGFLGSGTFADVFKAREKNGKLYAVKKSKRQFRSKKDRTLLMSEVIVMKKLGVLGPCDYIVQLVRAWQEDGYFFVQIDLAERGTLKDLFISISLNGKFLFESTIWHIIHDVSAGLQHIHNCGIVHLGM